MHDILSIIDTELATLRAEGARTDTHPSLALLEVLHAALLLVCERGLLALPYTTRTTSADRLAPLVDAIRAEGSALALWHASNARPALGDMVQLMLRGLREALDTAGVGSWGDTPEPMASRLWVACYPFMRPRTG